MVEMELSRIIISENSDSQVIELKEKDGSRSFPIVIGTCEADAIRRGVNDMRMPRPLTHDLLSNVIEDLGARLERVVVCDLRRNTFYAKLILTRKDEVVEVDSRPSDAIALAVGRGTPIYVEEKVLVNACKTNPFE